MNKKLFETSQVAIIEKLLEYAMHRLGCSIYENRANATCSCGLIELRTAAKTFLACSKYPVGTATATVQEERAKKRKKKEKRKAKEEADRICLNDLHQAFLRKRNGVDDMWM